MQSVKSVCRKCLTVEQAWLKSINAPFESVPQPVAKAIALRVLLESAPPNVARSLVNPKAEEHLGREDAEFAELMEYAYRAMAEAQRLVATLERP